MASGHATAAPIDSIEKFPLPRAHPCLEGGIVSSRTSALKGAGSTGTWNVGRCRTWVM